MSEVQWGGRIEGTTLGGDRAFSGKAFGVLAGSVPEGAEHWVAARVVEVLVDVLSAAPSPAALAADRALLSAALTQAARPVLTEQGAEGQVTVLTVSIDEEQLRSIEPPPELTVEQYASLYVERTLQPGAELAIAQRYRVLTAEALIAVDEQWRHRLTSDATLYQRWQQACAHYQAWLRQRG